LERLARQCTRLDPRRAALLDTAKPAIDDPQRAVLRATGVGAMVFDRRTACAAKDVDALVETSRRVCARCSDPRRAFALGGALSPPPHTPRTNPPCHRDAVHARAG